VPPSDSGCQSSFPNATYAIFYTNEDSSWVEWDFYSSDAKTGRLFHGADVPVFGGTDVTGLGAQVFSPASVDIPVAVGYGSNWSYTVSATETFYSFEETVTATADAWGTIILPRIGPMQALRVNQLTKAVETFGGLPVSTYFVREYYWLAPGFDKVVHIVSEHTSQSPSTNFDAAFEVRVVFASSATPTPVTGLQIVARNGIGTLTWQLEQDATTYQVQTTDRLSSTNWQTLGFPVSNSWVQILTAPQRFYRVLISP
jgi:hypothetical protein